jgi:hypothetical protein
MKKKWLIWPGLASFLITLIALVPTALLVPYMEKNLSQVKLQNPRGTIWNGSAYIVYNNIDIGETNWTLKPWMLITGSLPGSFKIREAEISANGDIDIAYNQTLRLENTNFNITGAWLSQLQSFAKLTGDFQGKIEFLTIKQDNSIPSLQGRMNWVQGGITAPISLPDGNYSIKIKPDKNNNLVGKIQSEKAPLKVTGNVSLDQQWQYRTDLKIKAEPAASSLRGLLSLAGPTLGDGSVHIIKQGNLSQLLNLNP